MNEAHLYRIMFKNQLLYFWQACAYFGKLRSDLFLISEAFLQHLENKAMEEALAI